MKIEKRFLSILDDEHSEFPNDFSEYSSKLDYEKIADSIHEKLEYSGDNRAVAAILPFLNAFGRFFFKYWYIPTIIVVGGLGIYFYNNNPFSSIETTENAPVILSIFPNDEGGFGQLHYEGLTEGVKFFENKYNRQIEIIPLNQSSLNEMKNDDIGILIDRLRYYLEEKNVLAIHGPPVTECTSKILQEVYDSGKNIPIFVTSAAPKNLVKWDEIRRKVPLFRISTGVDDRAGHIADFIDDLLIRHENKMILLIEKNKNGVQTFGEKFYTEVDELSKNLNKYRNNNDPSLNRIDVIEFYRDELEKLSTKLTESRYLEGENVIYLLGVGSQYKFLVEDLYKVIPNKKIPKAQFGGWMNSYAIDKKFREGNYHLDKLFEITDLYIDHTVPMNERQRNFQEVFNKKVNPSLRDQAFSFDVGYVIYESYNKLCEKYSSNLSPTNHLKLTNELRTELEQVLGTESFAGVSGNIGFDLNKGGTNQQGKLQYSRFNPSIKDWEVINYNQIFSK